MEASSARQLLAQEYRAKAIQRKNRRIQDLDYYRNLQRPAPGVEVGDDVVVTSRHIPGDERWGRVTNVARVWITVKLPADDEQLFRLDTQHSKDGRDQFDTAAQLEHDKLVEAAKKALRDRQIDVSSRAQLPDGHLIAMADLLAALGQPAAET
jgi:hypothetical protein